MAFSGADQLKKSAIMKSKSGFMNAKMNKVTDNGKKNTHGSIPAQDAQGLNKKTLQKDLHKSKPTPMMKTRS